MPWQLILSQDQQALLLRRGNRPPRRFAAQPAAASGIVFDCDGCALDVIDRNMPCSGSCYNACRIDGRNVVWKEVLP